MKNKFKVLVVTIMALIMSLSFSVFAGDEWVQDGAKWKYSSNGNFVVSNWKIIKMGADYVNFYFDNEAHMVTGIKNIGGEYYIFDNKGYPISKKKIYIDNKEFETANKGLINGFPREYEEFLADGEWVKNNEVYNFIEKGQMVKNAWRLIGSDKTYSFYYFDNNGSMVTNFQHLADNNFYYFDTQGAAVSYSKAIIYSEEFETGAKGQLLTFPTGFSVEQYNKDIEESKAQVIRDAEEAAAKAAAEAEAEKNFLSQVAPTKSAEELAAEAAAQLERAQAAAAAQQAQYDANEAARLTLSEKNPAVLTVENDDDTKTIVNYKVPVFTGGNADAINNVIANKLKETLTIALEGKRSVSLHKNVKLNEIYTHQDIENHQLEIRFSGDVTSVLVYIDTNTLEMWTD